MRGAASSAPGWRHDSAEQFAARRAAFRDLREVVIADENAERVKDLAAEGFHAIEMEASDETALKDSGALTADATVVAIGENMQASILATLLLNVVALYVMKTYREKYD